MVFYYCIGLLSTLDASTYFFISSLYDPMGRKTLETVGQSLVLD